MRVSKLTPLLHRLFYLSLKLSTFPTSWENVMISPNAKLGDYADPNNYRPISLTPVILEIFKNVTSEKQRSFLEPLNNHQCGIRSCRSMGDLLALVSHF